jgi:hypothetical protein
MTTEFRPFGKIARLSREMVVTEKIDGTNASILIGEEGQFYTGSRTRWITPEDDNYGFSRWCWENKEELLTLGPGHHFGEWWGRSINRNYGLTERRFSLFNVHRWCLHGQEPVVAPSKDPKGTPHVQKVLPSCVGLVPVLYRGLFDTAMIDAIIESMREQGSTATPGFTNPEGVVVFHTASGALFKKTLEKDSEWKGKK